MVDYEKSVVVIEQNLKLAGLYKSLIDRIEGFEVEGTFHDVLSGAREVARSKPDLAIFSVYLDRQWNLHVVDKMTRNNSRSDLLVLVNFIDSNWITKAMEFGVTSFVLKSQKLSSLERAIRITALGGSYISPQITKMLITSGQHSVTSVLTDRETEVMDLLSQGKSYTMIAKELCISADTSRSHIKNIYTKLEVSSKAEAISKARSSNII